MRLVRRTARHADRIGNCAGSGQNTDSESTEATIDTSSFRSQDEPTELERETNEGKQEEETEAKDADQAEEAEEFQEGGTEHSPPPTWESTLDGQLYAKVTEICAQKTTDVELEDAVGALLDNRADPNVTASHLLGCNGLTILMRASTCGNVGVVKRLLAADGCEVDRRTDSGATALMLAARSGQTSVLRLLIEKGAEVSSRMTAGPDAGKSALDLAIQGKNLSLIHI